MIKQRFTIFFYLICLKDFYFGGFQIDTMQNIVKPRLVKRKFVRRANFLLNHCVESQRTERGLTLGADRQLLIYHLPVLLLIHTLTAEKRLDYKPDKRIMHTKETIVVEFFVRQINVT